MEDAFAKTLAQAASKKAQIYPAKLIEEQRLATVYGAAITHFLGGGGQIFIGSGKGQSERCGPTLVT